MGFVLEPPEYPMGASAAGPIVMVIENNLSTSGGLDNDSLDVPTHTVFTTEKLVLERTII